MELKAENVSFNLKGKSILQNVSVTFCEGRRTAIIGPNGAGKSTLLKILAGLNENYGGNVFLGGENMRKLKRKDIAKKLAILPQTNAAPPDTTVEHLADYGRFPYRGMFAAADPKADREAVEWALSVTNLTKFAARQVMTLSGGERQRAFIAMALAQRPQILLLDEPTTYLDIAHQLDVMNIIRKVNAEYGMTVVMVLHDINHALQYADETVIVKNGAVFAQGEPQKVLTAAAIKEVFGVTAEVFRNENGKSVLMPQF